MVKNYQDALRVMQQSPAAFQDVDEIVKHHSSGLQWDPKLQNHLLNAKPITFNEQNIRRISYRPFVPTNCYMDYALASRKYRLDEIFPESNSKNLAICVPGMGSTKPFSALIVDQMPDLELIPKCQCFPRYRFSKANTSQGKLLDDTPILERRDNITFTAWWNFQRCYVDLSLTNDDIFFFIYGVLHAPSYRKRFAVDLTKGIPRIPLVPDFQTFSRAGRALADLHLGFETCEEFPLESPPPPSFDVPTKTIHAGQSSNAISGRLKDGTTSQ